MGVFDRLPVDCLLGRSSFGQTLCKESILDQWENNILAHDRKTNEEFVMTRRQKSLEEAQKRADEMIDRENSFAVRNLSQKRRRRITVL